MEDYYAVLGVAPDATYEQIRTAYRRAARVTHPDMGGTHEEMVRLTEAWEVLSDPELRAQYDKGRAAEPQSTARRTSEEASEAARAAAETYPRQWSEFESWLDALTNDMAAAEYASQKFKLWGPFSGLPFPVASNSDSGTAFITLGAILGFVLFLTFMRPVFNFLVSIRPGEDLPGIPELAPLYRLFAIIAAFVVPAWIGAWIGKALHHEFRENARQKLRRRQRRAENAAKAAAAAAEKQRQNKIVITCPGCTRKLRVPEVCSELEVRCPDCRYTFSWRKETQSENASS